MRDQPTIQTLFDLRGRTALVTGGTGHLGHAAATALAEAGANVILTSRNAEQAQSVASELPKGEGAQHVGIQLNHMQSERLDNDFASALAHFGQIDILINNGNEHTKLDWTNATAEEFTRQLSNATGYFLLARLLHNHAIARQAPASIIMIGSMYGLVGSYPDTYEGVCPASPVAYHALKGGILQMTRHLAVYWAPDRVRVNALSPGPFPPPAVSQTLVQRLCEKSPMKRMGESYEVKGAIAFLASDASSYVTGQNIVVDGGWTAW